VRGLAVLSRTGAIALGLVASLTPLAASPSAAAAPKRITGKLSKPGYTVIALAANGRATSARPERRAFGLRPPAERMTLHLRAPNGRYAGPIVVGRDGKRAVVGVTAGARLGQVKVVPAKRYARAKVARRFQDRSRTAKARRGVPIGARVFGRVKTRARGAAGRGLDRDGDGVPGALDIDDDGDLVLDDVDRSPRPRSERGALSARGVDVEMGYEMGLGATLVETRNVNAPGVTDQEIDTFLARRGQILVAAGMQDSATGESIHSTAELDCGHPQSRTDPTLGGLVYCTKGGTGRIMPTAPGPLPPRDTWARFPDDFDLDDDGFGTLAPGSEFISHGASSTQIGTGDHLFAYVTRNGITTEIDTVLQYAPATPQALVSFDDGRMAVPVQYPVPGPDANGVCHPSCDAWSGTAHNPFPVAARTGEDVVLTVTLWRPQRRPIGQGPDKEACLDDPDPCEWVDVGGLQHTVAVTGNSCPEAAYSAPGPNMEIVAAPPPDPEDEDAVAGDGWILDKAKDARANPARTLTYTVNLSECLRSAQPRNDDFVRPDEWELGEARPVSFGSRDGAGGIAGTAVGHDVWFKRVAPPSP
jgi:hypothetical protein